MYVRQKKVGIYVFRMMVLLFFACLVPFQSASASDQGKINANNLNVRTAPSIEGNIIGKLNTGDQIKVLAQKGDWYEISYQNDVAYIHSAYVDIVEVKESAPVPKSPTNAQSDVAVIVNGEKLNLPIQPPIKHGHVLVPFRAIGETLGVKVTWLPKTRQVKAIDQGKNILFTIDSNEVLVDGKKIKTNPAPYIEVEHTVIPLRFFAENFDAVVGWNSETRTVYIKREKQVIPEEENPPASSPPQAAPPENVVMFANTDGLKVYPEPFTGGEAITQLNRGDSIQVIGEYNDHWLEVEFKDKTGYVYRSLLSNESPGELVGRVNATELNVRAQPELESEVIGQLPEGEMVQVYDMVDQWAKVKVGSRWGYVHAYYLDLRKDGQPYVRLTEPSIQKGQYRDWLTWQKQGNVVTTHNLTSEGVEIITNASDITEFQGSHPGIKKIRYVDGPDGMHINVQLQEGYHFVVRHFINNVRMTIMESGLKGKRIVVDAGHGDHDPGAIGVTGLHEKNVNLAVSLKLKNLLERAGANVILTRSDDTFIALSDRVRIAHQNDADAFISVHSDSFRRTSEGSTSFYHSGENPSWEQSKQLSDIAIQKLTSKLGTVSRGSDDKSLHVIRETEIPAILVELAFLSNPHEEAMLKKDEFRQKAADALFETLVRFYH